MIRPTGDWPIVWVIGVEGEEESWETEVEKNVGTSIEAFRIKAICTWETTSGS